MPGSDWLLNQGGWGVAVLLLLSAVVYLFLALQRCKQEQFALLERVLGAMTVTSGQLSDNTKAIEVVLTAMERSRRRTR